MKKKERERDENTQPETERNEKKKKETLFIQLVMTKGRRDVAYVDLTYICASGVSKRSIRMIFNQSISTRETEKDIDRVCE